MPSGHDAKEIRPVTTHYHNEGRLRTHPRLVVGASDKPPPIFAVLFAVSGSWFALESRLFGSIKGKGILLKFTKPGFVFAYVHRRDGGHVHRRDGDGEHSEFVPSRLLRPRPRVTRFRSRALTSGWASPPTGEGHCHSARSARPIGRIRERGFYGGDGNCTSPTPFPRTWPRWRFKKAGVGCDARVGGGARARSALFRSR